MLSFFLSISFNVFPSFRDREGEMDIEDVHCGFKWKKKNQKTPFQRKERKLHGKNNNMKIDIIILQPPHYFKQIKGNLI